jgi:hypothetical protein
VSGLRPLDESQWLEFEEKLMCNSWGIAGDPDPKFYYILQFTLLGVCCLFPKVFMNQLFFLILTNFPITAPTIKPHPCPTTTSFQSNSNEASEP